MAPGSAEVVDARRVRLAHHGGSAAAAAGLRVTGSAGLRLRPDLPGPGHHTAATDPRGRHAVGVGRRVEHLYRDLAERRDNDDPKRLRGPAPRGARLDHLDPARPRRGPAGPAGRSSVTIPTTAKGRTVTVVPILLYHSVSATPPEWIAPLAVTPRVFARHLDVIAASGRTT